MEQNDKSIRAYRLCVKNASVGAYAIGLVMDRAADPEFRSLLQTQAHAYQKQERKARDVLRGAGVSSDVPTAMAKFWTGMGIFMCTLTDRSDAKLSELMVQGTTMGVITMLHTMHRTGKLPDEAAADCRDVLRRENAYLESLKKYL